jgi:hypothetical protein
MRHDGHDEEGEETGDGETIPGPWWSEKAIGGPNEGRPWLDAVMRVWSGLSCGPSTVMLLLKWSLVQSTEAEKWNTQEGAVGPTIGQPETIRFAGQHFIFIVVSTYRIAINQLITD